MSNYTIFGGFENPRRGRQARNLTTTVPKILDLKSSSEQICAPEDRNNDKTVLCPNAIAFGQIF